MNGPRAIVLGFMLLAGCISEAGASDGAQPPSSDAAGPDAGAAPAPLELAGCREQIGIFPVADEDARASMPEGFAPLPPVPPSVYPGADPTGASATLLFVAFFCEESGAAFLVPWFPAMPPPELRQEGVTYHAVAPLVLAADDGVASWFSDAGFSPLAATLDQSPTAPETPASIATRLSAEGDGATFALAGASPKSEAATPPEWLRVFLVDGATLLGAVDVRVSEHVHWQFGSARVEGALPGVVSPTQPGLSTHSAPGFAMNLTSVPLAHGS